MACRTTAVRREGAGELGRNGLIRGTLSLGNPTGSDLAPLEVSALVELERREVVLTDGHRRAVPSVGPARTADR